MMACGLVACGHTMGTRETDRPNVVLSTIVERKRERLLGSYTQTTKISGTAREHEE